MLRITTGTAKNKRLKAPNIEGFRAVQEVAKSSLFSILGEKVKEAICLDLFSGSGNLGLEALSRGAVWCDFVDEDPRAVKIIKENILSCRFEEKARAIRSSAVKYAGNAEKTYDIVFVDPFYNDISHVFLMKNLDSILNKDGIIAFFHGTELNILTLIKNASLKVMDKRRFGKSYFTLLSN